MRYRVLPLLGGVNIPTVIGTGNGPTGVKKSFAVFFEFTIAAWVGTVGVSDLAPGVVNDVVVTLFPHNNKPMAAARRGIGRAVVKNTNGNRNALRE